MKKNIIIKLISTFICMVMIISVIPTTAQAAEFYDVERDHVIVFQVRPSDDQPDNYAFSKFYYAFESHYLSPQYNVPSDGRIEIEYDDIVSHYLTYCVVGNLSYSKSRIGVEMRVWEVQYVWKYFPMTSIPCGYEEYQTINSGRAIIGTADEVIIEDNKPVY